MEFKINVDPVVFNEFVLNHANCHYGKTSMWAEVKRYQENYTPVLSGLYEHGELKATALLLLNQKWGTKYCYIPWGICMNYKDIELLQTFFHALRNYGFKNKIAFIRMDPNVRRYDVENKENTDIVEAFLSAGFEHKGFGYGYDGSWSNRWTLMIDIDKNYESIAKNFSSPRKSAIKKHNVYSIHTEEADLERLDVLCNLEKDLAQSKGFKPHSKAFFENISKNFPGNYVYAISTLDIDDSILKIEAELASKKYAKDPEAKQAKQKSLDELMQLKEKYGTKVEIAAGLFLFAHETSWDLYLYKCSDFNFINGTDEIHQFMIQAMQQRGVKHYDMCGFSGSTDPQDPYYGLYLYKSSFGSEVVEHIGEFNLILNAGALNRFTKTDRIVRKVKRKINYLTHKQK